MEHSLLRILSDREWILTNGVGGYALGFGNLLNKRKYNGLLIASNKLKERHHILASLEEKLETEDGFFFLDSNHYTNCIYPEGFKQIVKAWLRPYYGALYSSLPLHKELLIFKEIFMVEGKNAIVIKYSNLGSCPVNLIVRPKFTLRNHHFLNPPGTWDHVSVEKELTPTSFRICRKDTGLYAFGYIQDGELLDDTQIYRSVYYPREAIRGYDSEEDLFSPVRITLNIPPQDSVTLVFSSEHLTNPWQDASKAEKRYKRCVLPSDHPLKTSPINVANNYDERSYLFDFSSYNQLLECAAQDFICSDHDMIAGYPWFGSWGRDTLISLSGLRYLKKGVPKAIKILTKYGAYLKDGILPNIFGEGGVGTNYDSIDASLWYVLRCYEYAPENPVFFSYATSIVLNFLCNMHLPFTVGEDGLIDIFQSDRALTWMDAKIYGTPVTPRWGKPVEINALWFNALCIVKELAAVHGLKELQSGEYSCSVLTLETTIQKVLQSFAQYVGSDYLADRLVGNEPVHEIRPNAVMALSLPFSPVDQKVLKMVWNTAKEKLLTPYGLRSLDPSHSAFKQKYIGNQKQRDLAYHQGTVWSYLLLPFAKLTFKALKDDWSHDDIRKEVSRYVWVFREGFLRGEMASVAEVWDGLDPYSPKGCPAQAWSVFSLLEIERMLL